MKIETFEKAKDLQNNIKSLKKIIKDVEKEHHWISLVSACCKNEVFSRDFYESLLEFAKLKLAEYEKEFADLNENSFFNFDSPAVRIDEKSYNKAIDDFAEAITQAYASMQSVSEVERATVNTIAMGIVLELKGGAE